MKKLIFVLAMFCLAGCSGLVEQMTLKQPQKETPTEMSDFAVNLYLSAWSIPEACKDLEEGWLAAGGIMDKYGQKEGNRREIISIGKAARYFI